MNREKLKAVFPDELPDTVVITMKLPTFTRAQMEQLRRWKGCSHVRVVVEAIAEMHARESAGRRQAG
jgi:hypothetical protein